MQDEYNKGHFNEYIKKIIKSIDIIKNIQNKYRTNPLKRDWSPWTPICEGCGKIITPRVRFTPEGLAKYKCEDYAFETMVAKGCNHKAVADPLKDEGKLVWKSEWAAQWARWNICSEGAGKEYQVPNSAFWINSEIVESVLNYPSPEPIFYEHILVDGEKMSASLGNVIYPKDWLQVANPQILRFFYNKRLMMTRSFSWKELPNLYEEYDNAASIYKGDFNLENEKESAHLKRMLELSNKENSIDPPLNLSFTHAAIVAQTFSDPKHIIANLKKTGHFDSKYEKQILQRISKASEWVRLYASEEYRFVVQTEVSPTIISSLSTEQKKAIKHFNTLLSQKSWKEKELFSEVYEMCKTINIKPKDFFKAAYLILLNKEQGPRLIPFVLALGERATNLFDKI